MLDVARILDGPRPEEGGEPELLELVGETTMKFDRREPCASCPYRTDAPLKLWHRSEFEGLLANDGNELRGATYGCHEFRKQPREEHRPCIGWLLDQRRRGYPSIQLRLMMIKKPAAGECATEARLPEGVTLYPSIKTMCRANGVRAPRNRKTPPSRQIR